MSTIQYLRQKRKVIGVFAGAIAVGMVFVAVLTNVFAHTQYYLTDATVELDGVNDGVATIELRSPDAHEIFSIEGNFAAISVAEDPENPLYALTTLTPPAGITPSSNVVSDGRILWQDASWENPIVVEADGTLWTATYRVGKDTPAGQYLVFISGARIASEEEDFATINLGTIYGHINVIRNDTPAVKPNQVVTFRDDEGHEIGAEGITKYYGDEDFTVTKEVTTGDGEIREYHPDDDGTGRIAHTAPDSDLVGVGEPGDVEICAWLDETENYAETKACYTVHVLKRPLDIVGVTIEPKTYDGTTNLTVTNVTFEDRNLNSDQWEIISASFDDGDAGANKTLHVTVGLTGGAEDNYILNASNFETTATISPFPLTADNVTLIGSGTYQYNPDGVEPDVRVEANTHGGLSTLVEGTDYEVSYSNNTSVGTGAKVTVTGVGNYATAEPVVLNFTIEARGINTSNLIIPSSVVEGHIVAKDEIRMNVDGRDLVKCENDSDTDCDYVVTISGNTGIVGDTVNVSIEGRNNYTGVANGDIAIVAKQEQTVTIADVTNTTVNKSYGDVDFTYVATSDGDGEISYRSTNEAVATVDNGGKVTVVGVGETNIVATAAETDTYAEGVASYHLVVSKKTITISSVTVSNKVYDGTTDATVIDAVLSDDDLLIGDGFSIDEVHFTDASVGSYDDVYVRIKLDSDAFGLYQFEGGSRTAETAGSAEITAFTLGADNSTAVLANTAYTYDGEEKKPTANVTVDLDGDGTKETVLTAGTDYTINYSSNTDAGTASVAIAGKGNYTGSLAALEFAISKFVLNADNTSAELNDTTYTYDGEEKKPTANVTVDLDGDGTKETVLTADTDYMISYNDNIDAGTATATIASKGNYTGSLDALEFTINKAASGSPTEMTSGLSAEVGKTLADLGELSEGFAWVDPTTPITAGMNDYPATYTQDGDTSNYTTIDVSVPVLGFTEEYEVIVGAGQEYVIGESKSALFEIDADYELFEEGGEVYVDNAFVEAGNYDSWSNSTVIEFNKGYMDSLALGEHSLAVLFNDGGVARTTFKVVNPTIPDDEAENGDSTEESGPATADTGVFTGTVGGAVATSISTVVLVVVAGVIMKLTKKSKKED